MVIHKVRTPANRVTGYHVALVTMLDFIEDTEQGMEERTLNGGKNNSNKLDFQL